MARMSDISPGTGFPRNGTELHSSEGPEPPEVLLMYGIAGASLSHEMKVGVVFPSRELAASVDHLRAYISGVSEMGFDHIVLPDHVLGVDPARREDDWSERWPHESSHVRQAYTHESEFPEPMVTLGYIAALTSAELVTGILVLPQRQTALAAKQAAQLELLAEGGIRLGVGIGWNHAEFEALGMPFARRGPFLEEQLQLLRRLWSEPSLEFVTDRHKLRGVGIAPRPHRRIPIWLGGGTSFSLGMDRMQRPLERIGRLADGWYLDSATRPGEPLARALAVVNAVRRQEKGESTPIPLDGRILLATCDPGGERELFRQWSDIATHVTIDTLGCGYSSADEHLEALASTVRSLS